MKKDYFASICWAISALFFGSIFWTNFHSAFWYDMDMALNSHEAKLIWEQRSLFPEGWIFGNQYQIVDTVNVAALFYGIVHQSTLAMSLASSLNVILIVFSFIWCLKPFVSNRGIAIGALCILGGTIFGTSAASYTKGFQVLYTMASCYASYLIVLLLTLGAWLRMKEDKKIHWLIWGGLLLLNFGIGMNSLRETLILGIPLLLFAALFAIIERKPSLHVVFATLIFATEVSGYLFMKSLNIPASTNMSSLSFNYSGDALFSSFINSSKNVLRISGIALARDGSMFIPLTICAIIVAGSVVYSLFRIIRSHDRSTFAILILFTALSVMAVFAAGVLVFRTRDIYFFVYWLLAALSVIYVLREGSVGRWFLLGVAIISYAYHFIPDFVDYHRYNGEMKAITEQLIEEGYTTIYGDDCAIFAAASKDRIVATPIRLNEGHHTEAPLVVFPYNKDLQLYDALHFRNSIICISNYYLDQWDQLPTFAKERFLKKTELIHNLSLGKRAIELYHPKTNCFAI